MNNNFISQYNTLVNTLQNRDLLAVTPDNQFTYVGNLGRAWRSLTGFVSKQNTYSDCEATTVGNKIVRFVKDNQSQFSYEQGARLVTEMIALKQRMRRNSMNMDMNFRTVAEILNIDIRSLNNHGKGSIQNS